VLPLTLLSHYRQDIQGNRTVEHGPEIFRKFHGPILPILLRIWIEGILPASPLIPPDLDFHSNSGVYVPTPFRA